MTHHDKAAMVRSHRQRLSRQACQLVEQEKVLVKRNAEIKELRAKIAVLEDCLCEDMNTLARKVLEEAVQRWEAVPNPFTPAEVALRERIAILGPYAGPTEKS